MDREQFLVYIGHFNNKRYEPLTSYFADDITVEYFDDAYGPYTPAKILHGRAEFIANYKGLHAHTREILELGDFITQGNLMFVELYTEFHTFGEDPTGKWEKGNITIMTNWVLYTLDENDKMKRIRIAHFRNSDPKTARYSAES